jgi:hypothetical protein
MSDHKGAALIYPMLPDAETIIADSIAATVIFWLGQ